MCCDYFDRSKNLRQMNRIQISMLNRQLIDCHTISLSSILQIDFHRTASRIV